MKAATHPAFSAPINPEAACEAVFVKLAEGLSLRRLWVAILQNLNATASSTGGVVLGLYSREKLAEDVLTFPEVGGFVGMAYSSQP